ncbi:GJC2 [Lepeophtheirus salmonis]|uniref:GJC2 n=1 Tax=Lepeophtheirus salmonis TaxID=72036 RepID=A0A7R8CKJ8_LEPSM|nr:GJC2 [Lepeophtheirus salmonis]CAF2804549.1 GJC2 [Lepeophtheirus salmonis]
MAPKRKDRSCPLTNKKQSQFTQDEWAGCRGQRGVIVYGIQTGRPNVEIAEFPNIPSSTVKKVARRYLDFLASGDGGGNDEDFDVKRKFHKHCSGSNREDMVEVIKDVVDADPGVSMKTMVLEYFDELDEYNCDIEHGRVSNIFIQLPITADNSNSDIDSGDKEDPNINNLGSNQLLAHASLLVKDYKGGICDDKEQGVDNLCYDDFLPKQKCPPLPKAKCSHEPKAQKKRN